MVAISAPVRDMFRECLPAIQWRQPMSLSDWADENAYLSADASAEPGRFRAYPYQRGIQNAMTDPAVEQVTVMKSARVGYTRMVGNFIAYHIAHDPCPIMMVQPTIDMAEDYSKNDFENIARDFSCLSGLVTSEGGGKRRDTLTMKRFPGGSIRFIGSNSPTGFRKVDIRVVVFDEVDAYPIEAGNEGDPISLGKKRAETFWNRKIVLGSTPTDGLSRIAREHDAGDCRKYHVPCPRCGHMHVLKFKNMKWPEGDPWSAYFACPSCEEKITHDHKVWMVERGEWIASKPFHGHASFHIWTAYSYAANATWGHIAAAFLEAQAAGPRVLKTFVNTWLGEVWKDAADAPDWNTLYSRREAYARGAVPVCARVITAATDVQQDRLEVEVVAWGPGLESWTLDYLVFEGDTDNIDGPAWKELDKLLARQFPCESGLTMPIAKMAVDAGYNTQVVWNWCRRHGLGSGRVYPTKGVHTQMQIIKQPVAGDVSAKGKRKKKGVRLWPIGVSHVKRELYGWYRLPVPSESNPIPDTGFCHFGEFLDDQYFKMITAEELVRSSKTGKEEWVLPSGRRNEALDCRVYNRAMAYLCGADTWQRDYSEDGEESNLAAAQARAYSWTEQPHPPAAPVRSPEAVPAHSSAPAPARKRRSGFWKGRSL